MRNASARAGREQRLCGVLMIDMDGLKQINDGYGHRIGDAALIEFADRLKKATRGTDTAARLGGDEFGVILIPLETVGGMEVAVQRIESQILASFVFEGRQYPLKASIGSALMPQDGTQPEALLELADQRMYAAKQLRRKSS